MLIEADQKTLEHKRTKYHSDCVICGQDNSNGLCLQFRLCSDGFVEANWICPQKFQGYHGILHGGIISSLLDSAMENCLFAHKIVAVTAELKVRFRHPIIIHTPIVVRAELRDSHEPLYTLKSNIMQQGIIKAQATGKFMNTNFLNISRSHA